MTLTHTVFGATDVGRKREHNEDAFLVDSDLRLFVVCDGMGGHLAGEVASATATAALQELLLARRADVDGLRAQSGPEARAGLQKILEQAIEQTCNRVWEIGRRDRTKRGMGCTLDAVLLTSDGAVIGHVGDSRVYLLREGRANRLTEDHTLVAAQIKAGLISKEEAATSSWRSVLTRAIGIQASVSVDTLYVDLQPGDRFLLCSDGLYNHLGDEELSSYSRGALAELPGKLIQQANERGGSDNITAVVLEVGDVSSAATMPTARLDASSTLKILARIPLFAALSYKEQTAVLALGNVEEHNPGQVIVKEDEPGSELFLVLKGRVQITKNGIQIRELPPGGHFGEMSLVQDVPRSASAVAADPTHVLRIGRGPMMGLMRRDPTLAVKLLWNFVQTLADRLRLASTDLVEARLELNQLHGQSPFVPTDQ